MTIYERLLYNEGYSFAQKCIFKDSTPEEIFNEVDALKSQALERGSYFKQGFAQGLEDKLKSELALAPIGEVPAA